MCIGGSSRRCRGKLCCTVWEFLLSLTCYGRVNQAIIFTGMFCIITQTLLQCSSGVLSNSCFKGKKNDAFHVEKLWWDYCGCPTEWGFSELVKGGLVESHFNGVSFLTSKFWIMFSETPHVRKFPKDGQFQMKQLLYMNSLWITTDRNRPDSFLWPSLWIIIFISCFQMTYLAPNSSQFQMKRSLLKDIEWHKEHTGKGDDEVGEWSSR